LLYLVTKPNQKPNQTSKQSSSSHYGLPEINEV